MDVVYGCAYFSDGGPDNFLKDEKIEHFKNSVIYTRTSSRALALATRMSLRLARRMYLLGIS